MGTNVYTTNQDIRDYLADNGVTQRMLAKQMGVSDYKVCMMLKKELSEKEKEDIIRHIDAIVEDSHETADQTAVEDSEDDTSEEPEEADGVSNATKFQIGERVKIPSRSGAIGTVSDVWHSLLQNKVMYAVSTEGGSIALYREDQLEPAPLPIEYTFSTTVENNVAVVCMVAHQGEKSWVCSRGHAHILHDGEAGMAQAVSFAAKRMFESLDTKNEKRIYFKEDK